MGANNGNYSFTGWLNNMGWLNGNGERAWSSVKRLRRDNAHDNLQLNHSLIRRDMVETQKDIDLANQLNGGRYSSTSNEQGGSFPTTAVAGGLLGGGLLGFASLLAANMMGGTTYLSSLFTVLIAGAGAAFGAQFASGFSQDGSNDNAKKQESSHAASKSKAKTSEVAVEEHAQAAPQNSVESVASLAAKAKPKTALNMQDATDIVAPVAFTSTASDPAAGRTA